MRATAVSAFGFVLGLVTIVAASPAAALSSVGLEWRGTGGLTTVTVSTNAQVTLIADVTLTVDVGAETVFGVFVSFEVDGDGGNELNVIGASELLTVNLPGMANTFSPLDPGTTTTITNFLGPANWSFPALPPTLIEGFDQASLTTGLTPGNTVTLGSIKFQTNPWHLASFDDADVRVIVQQNGIDVISDTSGSRCIGVLPRNDCPYEFGELRVNAPEPTTSALIALGLGVGLFYSRRR